MADLSNTALRMLGIKRGELIDTEKDRYPQTRIWAQAVHNQCPDVQGLCWISWQDDRAQTLVLFGDRVPADALVPTGESEEITKDQDTYSAVVGLADRIGVQLVNGRLS